MKEEEQWRQKPFLGAAAVRQAGPANGRGQGRRAQELARHAGIRWRVSGGQDPDAAGGSRRDRRDAVLRTV